VALLALPDEGSTCTLVVGSAINQGGRSSGLTAPNGPSQTQLIREVIAVTGSSMTAVGYVSIHGTGTPLGDPIEANALGQALVDKGGSRADNMSIGAVKSCFGHTEGAAGLTGVVGWIILRKHEFYEVKNAVTMY
jgi:acyl transferase domain-containing protein